MVLSLVSRILFLTFNMNEFDSKYKILDQKTPRHELLSAQFKQSFAYYTLRERLPVIITQVLDNLSKDKEIITNGLGDDIRAELKEILGNISKLKYELQTDKALKPLVGNAPDIEFWNTFINQLEPGSNTFFRTCWLYAECYMYRVLQNFFENSSQLSSLDYFAKQKETALLGSWNTLELILKRMENYTKGANYSPHKLFNHLLKLNLWGNRYDLSISAGQDIKQTEDPFNAIDSLNSYILIDNCDKVWKCIESQSSKDIIIDFVNDNSGYELLTDFLVANFLLENKLASKIRFHVKRIPWYISDVTPRDFHYTIEYLSSHESTSLKHFGKKMLMHLKEHRYELLEPDYFWTSPYEYYRMASVKNDLYTKLSEAHLAIFKGDLNYRKLIGDFNWDSTEAFETCLRGFRPTNLCTLRTVKADSICGLEEGVSETLTLKDPNWMTTGEYGVIQFAAKEC